MEENVKIERTPEEIAMFNDMLKQQKEASLAERNRKKAEREEKLQKKMEEAQKLILAKAKVREHKTEGGYTIPKCCVSCKYYGAGDHKKCFCKLNDMYVNKYAPCNDWEESPRYAKIGKNPGEVRDRAFYTWLWSWMDKFEPIRKKYFDLVYKRDSATDEAEKESICKELEVAKVEMDSMTKPFETYSCKYSWWKKNVRDAVVVSNEETEEE